MKNKHFPLLLTTLLLSVSLQSRALPEDVRGLPKGFRFADESLYTAPLEKLLSEQFETQQEYLSKSRCSHVLDKPAAERSFRCNYEIYLIQVLQKRLELYKVNSPAELQKDHKSHDFALYQKYFHEAETLVAQENPELAKALDLSRFEKKTDEKK